MTELHDKLCHVIVNSTREQLDAVASVDVQIHNTISEAESMKWEFDLKDAWLTPSRWSMMCNQYIDKTELALWLSKCEQHIQLDRRGIATMRTKEVKARGGAATGHTNKETRRWGSCMLALTYKAVPSPQITLYSRTSYLGYLGALDLSIAWMCGRYLAKRLGCNVENFKFVWMNECLQYHSFKSLAFLLNHRDSEQRKRYRHVIMKPDEKLKPWAVEKINNYPALYYSRKWMQKLLKEDAEGKTLGDMTYNTYRRIRRRFHTEVLGYEYAKQFEGWSYYKVGEKKGEQKEFFKAYQPLPSTDIHGLNFQRLGLSIDSRNALRYNEDEYDDRDDLGDDEHDDVD